MDVKSRNMERNKWQIEEGVKTVMVAALEEQKLYSSYNVFHHYPEFYDPEDDRYAAKVHIVKWNTRSTRMTVLFARYDEIKAKWVFARKKGLRRAAHGEKMR